MSIFRTVKENFQQQGVLTQIIVVNVAIFLTVNLVGNIAHSDTLEHYLSIPIGGDLFIYRFWTLFTYMFTHANLMHLFWNMFLFYFMAQVFFTIMGQKKLLYVYVMSGLCGGALVLIAGLLFPPTVRTILLGASAAVLGVGAVMAVYSPNYRVFLFGMFEMSYKYFFILTFVVSTVIDLSVNTGGKISHVGGTIFGLVYGYYLKRGTDLFNVTFNRPKSKLKVVSHNKTYSQTNSRRGSDDEVMNALLDKISKSGYDSLTKKEKEELFKLSQKK